MPQRFGDIVLVRFPFTSQGQAKQRPAVVVSSAGYEQQRPDTILLAITSQIRTPAGFGEAEIVDWQAAGLLKPSAFKPILFTAERRILRRQLGQLSNGDQSTLNHILGQIIG